MKEDILEQLCEEYLQLDSYFTISNVKFRPDPKSVGYDSKQDSVHSDVDVVGYNPLKDGVDKVVVCSCKSLQEGFFPAWEIRQMTENRQVGGREAWRRYRELWKPKWAQALKEEIRRRTGSSKFIYRTVVTAIGKGESKDAWENCERFKQVLGCPVEVLTLDEMIKFILPHLTTTVANSNIGRILQLLKACGFIKG